MNIFLGEPPANIKQWIIEHYTPPTPPTSGPLCFTAEQANSTVRFDSMAEGVPITEFYPDMNLQYSTDGSNWTVMDLTQPPSNFTLANVGDKIYFKAVTENPNGFRNNGPACQWKMTGKISASGNIQYLLKSDGSRTDVPSNCYSCMFDSCHYLTSAPDLPATTLALECYSSMFNSCSNLTQAPALPATTLAEICYQNMFNSCSNLTQAPALPATTLASGCYSYMFANCTQFSECHMKASMEGVYSTSTHGDTTKTVVYDL